jgi:AcrR family transcriptional regulator
MSTTRDDIIEAAARLMFNGGYVHTSIGVIAAEAGVAVQTIYNTVGSKADLLSAVLDRTAAGDAQPLLPSVLRDRVAEARTAGDVLTVLADWFAEANRGTAAIDRVLSQAAAVDADAARLEQRRATQRLHSYGGAAGALRERRGLRRGLSDHEAAAVIWSIGHPQGYRMFVDDIGWSFEAYREWLGKSLAAALS